MEPVAKPAPDLTLAPQKQSPEPSQAAEAAERRLDQFAAEQRASLMPNKLLVRLDENAGRFVQTLTDSTTQEMLRKYPSESQLAFSRAVQAYMRALSSS